MSNPKTFVDTYAAQVQKLYDLIQDLRGSGDRIVADPGMLDAYFAIPGARTDIAKADILAVKGAIDQVIFAYDSGNPSQKSLIFKMLP